PMRTYSYTTTFDLPGCPPNQTSRLHIVIEGFTYDELCFKVSQTLDDVVLFDDPSIDISPDDFTWYDDPGMSNILPDTTPLVAGATYYVNLGPSFGNCTQV